jgi:hypothetical protein
LKFFVKRFLRNSQWRFAFWPDDGQPFHNPVR